MISPPGTQRWVRPHTTARRIPAWPDGYPLTPPILADAIPCLEL
jgi:hypothetical protein